MTRSHQRLNPENVHQRESTVESSHSRRSSSSQDIVDSPPPQRVSRHQSGRGSASADGRLQQSHSEWTSGPGVITDRPPLQPLSYRGSADGRLQQSDDSRWSSGSQANFDTTWPKAVARSVSLLKHSVEMKTHDITETTVRALLQQSDDSRWSSGSQAGFDTTCPKAVARRVSLLMYSVEMKNYAISETTVRALLQPAE
jgi:hypothetical protein